MTKRINKLKRNIDILNHHRRLMGIKELKLKIKKCCKCSVKFETTSSDICCPNCRLVNNKFFNFYGGYGEANE